MNIPSYTTEAQFLSIRRIIEDIQGGFIFIPRFQRPFVWSDEQRLELLRSIKESMPVGSLLVWRTSKLKLACYERLGPHKLPIPPENEQHARGYLLDGHQRLSTLFGLFVARPTGAVQADDEEDWDVRYNLREESFVFARQRRYANDPMVALPDLLDSRSARRLQRELDAHALKKGWREEDLEVWAQRIDDLAYRIQEYRVPVIPVVTDDLELATRTFSRINSQGTQMSEVHMVAALTWTEDFDLRERIELLKHALPEGWRDLDDRIVLNTLKGLFGLDITKADQLTLAGRVRDEPAVIQEGQELLAETARFLEDDARIPSSALLPYALQLVLLAVVFRAGVPGDPTIRARLVEWVQVSTLLETFSGTTYAVSQGSLDYLRGVLAGAAPHWTLPLPDDIGSWGRRFDLRSARARDVALRLALRGGFCDVDGHPLDGVALLRREGGDSVLRLIPTTEVKSDPARTAQQSVANVFVLPAEQHSAFRQRLRRGPDLLDSALEAHFLTADLVKKLRAGDVEGFLSTRLAWIEAEEKRRYGALRARALAVATVLDG